MLSATIKAEVRNLSPSERIDLIEYAVSLLKDDRERKKDTQSIAGDDVEKHRGSNVKRAGIVESNSVESSSEDVAHSRDTKVEEWTLASLAQSIAEAGEQALEEGASELPSDFATNHDHYLYGTHKK